MWRADSSEKTLMLAGLKAGEGDDRGSDSWMASLTQWIWVWVNSGSWWWTGRPGKLQSMGSQRVGHDWATELNRSPGDERYTEVTIVNNIDSCQLMMIQFNNLTLWWYKSNINPGKLYFEFWSFPPCYQYAIWYSLMMPGSDSKLSSPNYYLIMRINNQYT